MKRAFIFLNDGLSVPSGPPDRLADPLPRLHRRPRRHLRRRDPQGRGRGQNDQGVGVEAGERHGGKGK